MNKLNVLIVVRNHSDYTRLQPIVLELNWTARIVDLSQLSAALVTRRFDWVIAVDIPLDSQDFSNLVNYLEECLETRSFNVIHVHNEMIDVSCEKLKINWLELNQHCFAITCCDVDADFTLSKALHKSIRCGYSRFQTPMQARQIVSFFSNLTTDIERACMGLWELFINAVEHGNLDISYDEKDAFLSSNVLGEEVCVRLADEQHQNMYVRVTFFVRENEVLFDVKDEGLGFDWKPFMEINPKRLAHKNGRGIAVARILAFDEIAYIGNGNHVRCQIRNF